MKTKKFLGLRLWERKQNSVYSSYENKSKLLIKARKENKKKKFKFRLEKTNYF